MHKKTLFLICLFGICLALIYWYGNPSVLFTLLKQRHLALSGIVLRHPLSSRISYCIIYIVTAILALPGAAILTIAGGSLFGMRDGIVLTACASTVGATITFLMTRTFGKQNVEKQYPTQMHALNTMLKQEGALYLLTLRLIPIIPFFLINILSGVTNIPLTHYILISFIGMMPGIILYTYAGTVFASITSLGDLMSGPILGIFLLLALIPYLVVYCIRRYKKHRIIKE